MEIQYNIYPTLLDSFHWYLKSPKNKHQEMIDKINKVRTESTAASKGIALEKCIDAIHDKVDLTLSDSGEFYLQDGLAIDAMLVHRMAKILKNYKERQKYVQAFFDTKYGRLKMFGFMDYEFEKILVDVKSTERYYDGKYENNYQHVSYMMIAEKNNKPKTHFTYLVTDFEDIYKESYVLNQSDRDRMISSSEKLIEFIEENRHLITNHKLITELS